MTRPNKRGEGAVTLRIGISILLAVGLLAGCSKRERILEGERFGVREAIEAGYADPVEGEAETADAAEDTPPPAVQIPAQTANTDWPQKRGNAGHFVSNAALAPALTELWTVSIGSGNSKRHRLTAEPVVAAGKVFTLDSQSMVKAHSTAGATLWSTDLTPATDRNGDASGGGLAFGGDRLFVTTGFGRLVALDPDTGAVLWEQKTDSVVAGAPTFADGLVYIVSRDNRAWAVNAEDGRVRWQVPGTPSPSGMIGGAAPAVTDRLVLFPVSSSEVVATLRKSGIRVWSAAISGQRRGRVYANVADITGDPVVQGDTVFVGTQSGRTVALSAAGGERLWTAEEGAYSPVTPVDNSVFLVSDQGELVRLDAETGDRVWGVELPYFTREKVKRRKAVFANYGPVLAGDRLIVGSSDGIVRFFAPETGALLGEMPLRGGAASDPVVANGTLYLVSGDGRLHAYR